MNNPNVDSLSAAKKAAKQAFRQLKEAVADFILDTTFQLSSREDPKLPLFQELVNQDLTVEQVDILLRLVRLPAGVRWDQIKTLLNE